MFVYRKFYGCLGVFLNLMEDWRVEFDKCKVIGVVVIDFSKVFDCFLYELFFEKLKFYGVSENLVVFL